jgi:hypothetical protein
VSTGHDGSRGAVQRWSSITVEPLSEAAIRARYPDAKREGDVLERPSGEYSFEVLDDEPLVMVLCWELPFEVNGIQ